MLYILHVIHLFGDRREFSRFGWVFGGGHTKIWGEGPLSPPNSEKWYRGGWLDLPCHPMITHQIWPAISSWSQGFLAFLANPSILSDGFSYYYSLEWLIYPWMRLLHGWAATYRQSKEGHKRHIDIDVHPRHRHDTSTFTEQVSQKLENVNIGNKTGIFFSHPSSNLDLKYQRWTYTAWEVRPQLRPCSPSQGSAIIKPSSTIGRALKTWAPKKYKPWSSVTSTRSGKWHWYRRAIPSIPLTENGRTREVLSPPRSD